MSKPKTAKDENAKAQTNAEVLASSLAALCIAVNKNAPPSVQWLTDHGDPAKPGQALHQALCALFLRDSSRALQISERLASQVSTLQRRVQSQTVAVSSLQKEVLLAQDSTAEAEKHQKILVNTDGTEKMDSPPQVNSSLPSLPPVTANGKAGQAALRASKAAYTEQAAKSGETAAHVGRSAAAAAFLAGVEHHKAELQAAEAKRNESAALKLIDGATSNVELTPERNHVLRDSPDVGMVLPLRIWVTELQKEFSRFREQSASNEGNLLSKLEAAEADITSLRSQIRQISSQAAQQRDEEKGRLEDYSRMQQENARLASKAAKAESDRKNMARNANYAERKKAEAKAEHLAHRNAEILAQVRKLQSENENMASQRRSHLDRLTAQQRMLDEMRQLMATAFDMRDTHQGSSFKLRVKSIQPEEVASLLAQYSSRAADVVACNRENRELKARLLKSQEQYSDLQGKVKRQASELDSLTAKLSTTEKQLNVLKAERELECQTRTQRVKAPKGVSRPRSAKARQHLEADFGYKHLPATPIRPASARTRQQKTTHSTQRPQSATARGLQDAKSVASRGSALRLDTSQFAKSLAIEVSREKADNPFLAMNTDHLPSPTPNREVTMRLLTSPVVDHKGDSRRRAFASPPTTPASNILDSTFSMSESASAKMQWRFDKLMRGPGQKAVSSQITEERLAARLDGQVPDPDASKLGRDTESEGKQLAESIRDRATATMKSAKRMKMTGRFSGTKVHQAQTEQPDQSADEKITRAAAKRAQFMDSVNAQLGKAIGRVEDASAVSTVVQGKVRAHTQFRIRKYKHDQENSIKNVPLKNRPSSVAMDSAKSTFKLLDTSGKAAASEFHAHMTADVRAHLLSDSGAVDTGHVETQIRESKMRLDAMRQ